MLGYTYNIWQQNRQTRLFPESHSSATLRNGWQFLTGQLFHTLRSSDLKCCPTLLLKQICKKKGAINQPYQKPEQNPPPLFFYTLCMFGRALLVLCTGLFSWWGQEYQKEPRMHNQTLTSFFFMYITAAILVSGIRHTDKLRCYWLHQFKAKTQPYLGGRWCWIYGAEGRGVRSLFKTKRAIT